jgi:short-subunit dehydrogenase
MLTGMSSAPDRSPAPGTSPGWALVTGPTSGIGLSFAHALARRGHDLVLVARHQERLVRLSAELESTYGVRTEVLVADLIDRAQLATVEDRLADRSEPVRLLVNNAGFGLKGRFTDSRIDQEQAQLDVLVTAVMRLTHAGLRTMLAEQTGQIVNVSSVAGFLQRGSYSAAKSYVTKLSLWAHHEYGKQGVQVMALCPGFVRTDFHNRLGSDTDSAPRMLWLEPDRLVAEALADLDAGKALSVPSKRYKAIVAAIRIVPPSLQQRFQSMGRK